MPQANGLETAPQQLLKRLTPALEAVFAGQEADWPDFRARLDATFPRLLTELDALYGADPRFDQQLEAILLTAARGWRDRPPDLKARDAAATEGDPWFTSHREIGAVCYVDLFAENLAGMRGHIDYLRDLGVSYLHLMPLLKARAGENDGGYAVSDYRAVEPRLGTMAELERLAEALHEAGIRLCLDFVINHTADDHVWAQAAKAGDRDKQAYYRMFDDRADTERYSRMLREIFPDRGGDPFQWVPELKKWVWSTFYHYQWDLNFDNPALFRQMLAEMLFLANRGVDVLRLDAVPFIGKRAGTNCENQPEAHRLVRAFNALAAIAAPGLAFKSEAIVHPDEVARYVGPDEAQLSYFPALMVLLWEALASRDTRLLRHTLIKRFPLPAGSAWITYLRGHDDIGWGFADEDAEEMYIEGGEHRKFLNAFFTGRFAYSFARGLPFQENPRTGDCRISGTTASLAGLESALETDDPAAVDMAVRRILMLHGIIMTIGGVPLLYLGDEVAQLNDHEYLKDAAKRHDNRWVHRPATDWPDRALQMDDPDSPASNVFAGIRRLVALRKSHPVFGGQEMEILPLANAHVFAFRRGGDAAPVAVLANMNDHVERVGDWGLVALLGPSPWTDLVSGESVSFDDEGLLLEPYQFLCLSSKGK